MKVVNLLLFLPLFVTITSQSPPHFLNSFKQDSSNETVDIPPQYFFEVTLPLPTDYVTPVCSVTVLNHTFANTTGNISSTVTVSYTPPPATCDWSVAVLDFQAECKGQHHDGVAGVWIAGVELLRTSTAQADENGSFWNVRKDVSRYSSIVSQDNLTLTVGIENVVNNEFTGVYNVNVSLLFYSGTVGSFPVSILSDESEARSLNRKLIFEKKYEIEDKLGLDRVTKESYLYDTPADLIIPVSGGIDEGFWFKIQDESDARTTNVQIPERSYKAVLELFVSFHGDDEFWYMNPPDSYIEANNLPAKKANGAYREVLVTIDGKLVGTVIPFPVISPGGINPLIWKPVVSIGAFDLPSYDIDLTSYLRLLLDNQNHSIGFQIADGVSFWLVDANLHLWLDDSSNVQAIVEYEPPAMEIEREYEFKGLDGEFEIEAERSTSTIRWVQSSKGILKTKVTEEIKFKNKLRFKDYATTRQLEQTIKTKTKMKITNNKGHSVGEAITEKEYPLKITTETKQGPSEGSSLVKTIVIQGRSERFSDERTQKSWVLNHDLNCTAWMMVKNNTVVSETAENHQNYSGKDAEGGCYSRKVDVVDGDVITDETTLVCVK